MKVLINTERFFLRDLRVSDATKNYLSWFDDKKVKKYIKYSKFKNILDLKRYLKFQIKKKNSIFLGIFNKKGLHIGNVKLDNINLKKSTAFFGILIGNQSWRNKGVTPEVIKALSQWSFKKYKISKFILGVEKRNVQAIKAYKKSNFIELNKNNKNTIVMEKNLINIF